MNGTILEKIVATKRLELDAVKAVIPVGLLKKRIAARKGPRDFYAGVMGGGRRPALIAEIKKASPSAGLIRADFDPVEIAKIYAGAGAAALSVLTDRSYFQGDLGFIERVRGTVTIPVLRKDFMIDEYQIYESRAAGADAILLIAAILEAGQIDAWSRLAMSMGMASLIEVHNEVELRAVLPFVSAERRTILGMNNRDLHAQRIDLGTTKRLSAMLPSGMGFVAESGIKTRGDIEEMRRCGAAAVLIGEVFMRERDIAAKVRELSI